MKTVKSKQQYLQDCLRIIDHYEADKICLIEASRKIHNYSMIISSEIIPEFVCFIGISSQSEHFPLGSVRDKYNKEYLVELDEEKQRFIKCYKEGADEAIMELKTFLEKELASIK